MLSFGSFSSFIRLGAKEENIRLFKFDLLLESAKSQKKEKK